MDGYLYIFNFIICYVLNWITNKEGIQRKICLILSLIQLTTPVCTSFKSSKCIFNRQWVDLDPLFYKSERRNIIIVSRYFDNFTALSLRTMDLISSVNRSIPSIGKLIIYLIKFEFSRE